MRTPSLQSRLSHERLLSLVHYDPLTGLFYKKARRKGCDYTKPLGHVRRDGYRRLIINHYSYYSHRLAWFYIKGEWPTTDLDHLDTDKSNNRISNLRQTNDSLNGANKVIAINNTSGAKGVQKLKNNRWRASVKHYGKWISLGTYGSREEAREAYLSGARELFGEFARAS